MNLKKWKRKLAGNLIYILNSQQTQEMVKSGTSGSESDGRAKTGVFVGSLLGGGNGGHL